MILLPDLTQVLLTSVEWLVIASIKTIPLIIFVLIVQRLLRKKLSAAAHYLLWLSVMISLVIPFGWHLPLKQPLNTYTDNYTSFVTSEKNTMASRSTTVADNIIVQTTPQELLPQPTTSWFELEIRLVTEYYRLTLAIIWLCGVLALMSITLVRANYFHRIKRNANTTSKDLLLLLNTCKSELKINQPIQLLLTRDIQSPITLGWLRPAIVLPENIEQQLTPDTIKHVLLHELGHIKRQDIFFNWAACAINILHWFNPFVWLACRKMRMDMEAACDALVLNHLPLAQHKRYGATLIEISEIPRVSRRAVTTLGILENHTELKERLTMIKEFSTMNLKRTALLSVILMGTVITALAQPATQSSSQAATAIKAKTELHSESTFTLTEFAARAEKDLNMKVLVGQNDAGKNIQVNLSKEPLNYGQLLTQLKINEFTAYKSKDYIQIIQMRDARSFSIPVVEKNKTYYEDEVVTDYLKTNKVCGSRAVAVLRPLVPQYGHLTVHENSNTLVITDTYANIQRIKTAINALEANLDAPEDCTDISPPENRPQTKTNK